MKQIFNYKIADLNVEVRHDSSILSCNGAKYIDEISGSADIVIEVSEERILKAIELNKAFDRDYAEYFVSGMDFYQKIIPYSAFMIHSSCVAVEGKGFLFTADSGVGKSTHTSLWRQNLGERAVIINDDKPVVRCVNGKFNVYGTPWSGKNNISSRDKATASALVFLERGKRFEIETITPGKAVEKILPQMMRFIRTENAEKQFDLLDKFLKTIPAYVMKCTPDAESARLAWEYLNDNS